MLLGAAALLVGCDADYWWKSPIQLDNEHAAEQCVKRCRVAGMEVGELVFVTGEFSRCYCRAAACGGRQ